MRPETFTAIKLPNLSARIIKSASEELGLDWSSLLSQARISPNMVEDPNGIITGSQELLLEGAFVRLSRDLPDLWLRMGLHYRLMNFGPLGLAVLAAGTFRAGLEYLTSFRALTYSLMDYGLVDEESEATFIKIDDRYVPEDCREFCQARSLSAITRVLCDMHPGLMPIAAIETVLDDSNARYPSAAALEVPITFNAPVTRFVLKAGVVDAPLPMANPLLEQTYSDLCTNLIEEARISDEIVSRLYNLLVRSERSFPTAPEASRMLGLTERTLYRRLAMQNLTFGKVLDRVREQRASYLLLNTGLSIKQIADALGFAETASFSRAFKHWTGMSPSTLKR